MADNVPPPRLPPATPAPPVLKKRHWVLLGCGGLLAILIVIAAAAALTAWWLQRPIKPVVLKPNEQAVVHQKLQELEDSKPASGPSIVFTNMTPSQPELDHYRPGSKSIVFTDREVNGLLNQNTELGKTVRL